MDSNSKAVDGEANNSKEVGADSNSKVAGVDNNKEAKAVGVINPAIMETKVDGDSKVKVVSVINKDLDQVTDIESLRAIFDMTLYHKRFNNFFNRAKFFF